MSPGTYLGTIQEAYESRFIKVTTTKHPQNISFDYHQHQNPYLSILLKGAYKEYGKRKEDVLTTGSVIYRPAYYTHADDILDEDCTCCNIELKPAFVESLYSGYPFPEKEFILSAGQFQSLNHILVGLSRQVAHYEDYVIEWLNAISNSVENRKEPLLLQKVKAILQEEYTENHSLHTIAARVLCHPVYLARLFKANTGLTLGAYQRQLKVQRAYDLLLHTNLSVSGIAYELGFCDTAHFIRLFNSYYKITPHQLRLSIRKLI